MSREYQISREEVETSWKAVRRAAGSPGLDGKTIQDVEENLDDELYKIWNRMSSGSYQAQAVKMIAIPKAKGGFRILGVPTVTDRIAQGVIKARLEKDVDHVFHPDSYAYREGRSAIDAVLKARTRCMKKEWVVEIDIKGFFDNLDHDVMLEILGKYTQDRLVLLYSRKFLKAEGVTENQERVIREKGTPQGGVVSPVLANLYLHEAFDRWMSERQPGIEFERYADDIIIHCVSEQEAYYIRNRIEGRLKMFKLELHPEKTRVVYTGKRNDYDDRGQGLSRKFTFLGYDFKPRYYNGGIVFTPAMGQGALKTIIRKLEKLKLNAMTHLPIEIMAKELNAKCRGWIGYYGHCRRSELYKLADVVNKRLVKFLRKKHKIRLHGEGWKKLWVLKKEKPKLFVHWYLITKPLRAV